MKVRTRKIVFIISAVTMAVVIGAMIYLLRPADDGRTPAQRREIAEALWSMSHSSLTNEDVQPDDPRIPPVIRSLSPVDFMLDGNDAVVFCAGRPAEYHLTHLRDEPQTWILYVAGPGYFGHREVMRFNHN